MISVTCIASSGSFDEAPVWEAYTHGFLGIGSSRNSAIARGRDAWISAGSPEVIAKPTPKKSPEDQIRADISLTERRRAAYLKEKEWLGKY